MTLTLEDIRKKLKTAGTPAAAGDHALNPGMAPPKALRKAAVLILLVEREDGLHVVFTERAIHLSTHAGQISFPGGGCEDGDKDAAATALREAWEEIGLEPENVKIIGQMGDYSTRSGFIVTPVVGVLEKDQKWTLDENEVAGIFEVPLAHILAPQNLREESVSFEGKERHFFAMNWREFRIWGATAGMLKNFADLLSCQTPANDVNPCAKKEITPPKKT